MASLRTKKGSPYYFACFTLPDGTRTQRSTGVLEGGLASTDYSRLEEALGKTLNATVKITSKAERPKTLSARDARRLAKRIADGFEDAALAASTGRFTETRARKTIATIYQQGNANAEHLKSSSVDDFLDAWMTTKQLELGEGSHAKYQSVVDQFKDSLGSKARGDISNVTAADITRFRDSIARRLARGTVNVGLKIIRSAFAQARRDGLVDVNEAERVTILKRRQSESFERRPFTMDELKKILAAADDDWKGMILTGLYTGQRLGDVATLTWQNLDLQHAELQFVTQKTGRRQNIPLAPALLRHFEGLPASDKPDQALFPKAFAVVQEKGRSSQLSNQFNDLLASVGLVRKKTHHADPKNAKGRSAKRELNPISFHSLRHTATSLLKRAGVSDVVAMEIIGHDSASVSQTYTHIDGKTLKAAVALLPDVTK